MTTYNELPRVTVLVPCRNEAAFIERCLDSIVHNGYPESLLQVLVLDGRSEDATAQLVRDFQERHSCVMLIDNPHRITSTALNLGIAAATGDYIVWMSAHNRYDAGYIERCIDWSLRSGADNVGGVIVAQPRDNTAFGRAIVLVLANRFGNGGSKFRTSVAEPVWADTVFGGCYRRDVFAKVGLFNEQLVRGQDFEFNMRLRRAGLRTLLVPTIRSTYFARSTPVEFLKHNWANGVWAILPFRYSDVVPVGLRHLAPMCFVGSIIASMLLGLVMPPFRFLALGILGAYGIATIAASVSIATRERSVKLAIILPVVFWSLHISYGLGSLWAALRSTNALLRHAAMLARSTSDSELAR